tara:strand:- start:4845 stop:5969 length:1125 start_codon:yes stop_codon:yes gene_type:complete
MDKIYKYFMEDKQKNPKKTKNENNIAMLQGLHHLNKRNQKILELTNNLNMHENKEGYTGIGREFGIDLKSFSKQEARIVKRKLKRFKYLQRKYASFLRNYTFRYKKLMNNYMRLDSGKADNDNDKGVVHNCKVKCNQEKTNKQSIFACEVGCELKGPYLLECKNTYKDNKNNSCRKVVSQNKCNPSKREPILAYEYYLNHDNRKDDNGVTLIDGCCACGGGKFGKPVAHRENKNYKSCYQLNGTSQINNCLNAPLSNQSTVNNLPMEYSEIVRINKDMIQMSNEMFSLVNSLKAFNINLSKSKNNLERVFRTNSEKYDSLLDQINSFSKTKKDTLNMRVKDGVLKKGAYDIRNNVWLILAIAFGFTALIKIKDL